MKKYFLTLFLLLTSVTPTTNAAQNSEKDDKQPKESEIELMVDSLDIRKNEIIQKSNLIEKLEEELAILNKQRRTREDLRLEKELKEVEELMQRKEIY